MTLISNNNVALAICGCLKDKSRSEEVNIFKKIVEFLFRKKLLSKAPEILSQVEKLINKEEGRISAKVSSPEALSRQTKIHLEKVLKKKYSAKEVVLNEILDKNLLGGLKIEVNDEVIDLSVKNRIEKLQAHLIQG